MLFFIIFKNSHCLSLWLWFRPLSYSGFVVYKYVEFFFLKKKDWHVKYLLYFEYLAYSFAFPNLSLLICVFFCAFFIVLRPDLWLYTLEANSILSVRCFDRQGLGNAFPPHLPFNLYLALFSRIFSHSFFSLLSDIIGIFAVRHTFYFRLLMLYILVTPP